MNPPFRDGSFGQRFTVMGDPAEKVFEENCEESFVRYGLSRPPLQVGKLPKRIRYTPDYLTTRALVEVQGVGADQIVKLKVAKYNALAWWALVMPVTLFISDSRKKRHTSVSLERVTELIESGNVPLGKFPEGHPYWAIPTADLFE